MGLDFIDRVTRTSLVTGIVVALIAWARFGPAPAGAFAAGCAWSLASIHMLRILVGLVLGEPGRHKLRIAAALIVKVPVLYGAGYLLLLWGRFPVVGLLAGFAWPLCVIVLKAAARLMLGLDRTGSTPHCAGPLGPRDEPALDPAGPFRNRKGR